MRRDYLPAWVYLVTFVVLVTAALLFHHLVNGSWTCAFTRCVRVVP